MFVYRAGAMSGWLGALAAPAEDEVQFPAPIWRVTTTCSSSSREPCGLGHASGAQTHMRQSTHTNKNNNNTLFLIYVTYVQVCAGVSCVRTQLSVEARVHWVSTNGVKCGSEPLTRGLYVCIWYDYRHEDSFLLQDG